MKRKCILIRHGSTVSNGRGLYIGCKTDEKLSKEGREQCKRACKFYSEFIDALTGRRCDDLLRVKLFSSPMKRALETARLIFPEHELSIIEELKETDFGDFEGKNYKMLSGNPDYQRFIDNNGCIDFPNGETKEAFLLRNRDGLKRALSGSCSDDITIIVCHGGNIMSIMSDLTGRDRYDFMKSNLDGFILEFDYTDERISNLSYNSISSRLSD